jgi:hypothetical protein
VKTNRYKPAVRRELVLAAAIEVARQPGGWSRLTRQLIAIQADCSEGLVSRYLGDMPEARRAIMKAAIKAEIVEIIVQSIASHDGFAIKKYLPAKLRQRSIASLLG